MHANIGLKSQKDDDNHNNFIRQRSTIVKALTDYNDQNKLGATKDQIETLSWAGSEGSDEFHKMISERAHNNGTSDGEEILAYGKMLLDVEYGKPTIKTEKKK